jgi:hypothetical protein
VSIAWGSLVLLVLLLPGILFFLGVYWPEQFTREAESRSPLGQLAGALLIAFVLHGLSYALLGGVCGSWLPCIDIEALLQTISADPAHAQRVSRMLHRFRWWIFAYVTLTCLGGIGLGALYGWLVSKRKIRGFARHHWIYDLTIDGLTYAYVLTNVRQEKHVLMYKGFLRAFGLQQDGRFSYIVLTDVTRFYLSLEDSESVTSRMHLQKVIGASSPEGNISIPTETVPKKRVKSLFVIEGEDIANAVFDTLETPAKRLPEDELKKLIDELRDEILKTGHEQQPRD